MYLQLKGLVSLPASLDCVRTAPTIRDERTICPQDKRWNQTADLGLVSQLWTLDAAVEGP